MSILKYNLRLIKQGGRDTEGILDEHHLSRIQQRHPDKIAGLMERITNGDFRMVAPLTYFTEGQELGRRAIKGIEFVSKVPRKQKVYSTIIETIYSSPTLEVGNGSSEIVAIFEDNFLIEQHTLTCKNGRMLRVQRLEKNASGMGYRYYLRPITLEVNGKSGFLASDFAVGETFAQLPVGTVSNSKSFGNRTTLEYNAEITNQISIFRKSMHLAGNVSSIYECTIDGNNGNKGKLVFTDLDLKYRMQFSMGVEEHMWLSKYNRDTNGIIHLTDDDTGEVVPYGAGLEEQIYHEDTYSEFSLKRIESMIYDMYFSATDSTKVLSTNEFLVFTGMRGLQKADAAIKKEISDLAMISSEIFLNRRNGGLDFGNKAYSDNKFVFGENFRSFKTGWGQIVTFVHLPFLDKSAYAANYIKDNEGYPVCSSHMFGVDMSKYEDTDGNLVRNVQMVYQEGRSFIQGVEQGMTVIPLSYTGNSKNLNLATSQDKSSVHCLGTKMVHMMNPTTSFKLYYGVN